MASLDPTTLSMLAAGGSAATNGVVPQPLISAVIGAESGGNPNAVSTGIGGVNAYGLMQIQPATAADLGLTNSFDPAANVNAGSTYLARLFQRYGNWTQALSAYNTGYANSSVGAAYAANVLSAAGMSDTGTQAVPLSPSSVADTGNQAVGNAILSAASGAPAQQGTVFYVVAVVLIVALVAFGLWGVIKG